MCFDPVTLGISMALSGAGSYLSQRDADKNATRIAEARNRELNLSLDKQKAYSDEARGYLASRLQKFAPEAQTQSLEDAQTQRTDAVQSAVSAPTDTGTIPISGSAPAVVKGTIAKKMLEAFNQSTDKAKALGKLGGYGDNQFGNNLGVADTGRRIGTVNDFSRGTAALLPYSQDFAEIGATKPASMWGPLLMAAGNFIGGAAGGMKAPAAATVAQSTQFNPWMGR